MCVYVYVYWIISFDCVKNVCEVIYILSDVFIMCFFNGGFLNGDGICWGSKNNYYFILV